MRVNVSLDSLRKLGLTKYESEVYYAMLACGTIAAEELEQHCTVPITAIYPTLRKLLEKGFVTELKAEKKTYSLVQPKKAITSYVKRQEERLQAVKTAAIQFAETVEKQKPKKEREDVVKLSKGREISKQTYFDFLEKATKTVFIFGWRLHKSSFKNQILHAIRKASKRGVDVRIIVTPTDKTDYTLVKLFKEAGSKIRILPFEKFSILVADSTHCKISMRDTADDKYNLEFLHEFFVPSVEKMFLDMWKNAQPFYKE